MKDEIKNCLTWYMNKITEVVLYPWNNEFKIKELEEAHKQFVEELKKHIDFKSLTIKEAKELRFRQWEEEQPNFYLFPLWLVPLIPVGLDCMTINGKTFKYDPETVNNDIRMGCVAYGINLKSNQETNIIKVQFIRDNQPQGREYTYHTPVVVEVGDMVEIESKDGKAKGIVTQINVPEEEIAPFKDKAKSIIGKFKETLMVENNNLEEYENEHQ